MVVSSNDVKRSFSNKECLMKIQEYEKIRNIVVQMANARGQSLQPWERLRLLGEFDCACAAVVLDKKHKDWPLQFDSLKAVGNWFAERLSQKTECEVPKPFDEPKPTGRGLTPSSWGAACSSKETLPKPALAGSSVRIRELAEDGSLADTSGLSDKGFSAGVKVVDKKSKKEGVILSTDTCNVRVEWCDSGSTEAVKKEEMTPGEKMKKPNKMKKPPEEMEEMETEAPQGSQESRQEEDWKKEEWKKDWKKDWKKKDWKEKDWKEKDWKEKGWKKEWKKGWKKEEEEWKKDWKDDEWRRRCRPDGRGGYYLPHGQGFIDSHGQLRPGEGLIGKTRNRGGQREQAKRSDTRALINMVTKITDLRAGAGPPTE
ncbi:unnamed protein product [Effrenium voratum]|nr:unnamed protein product [Effrenium voratum]